MNRAEKANVIEQLKDVAERASIAVVTNFNGMTVEQMTDLRAKLREGGVEYQVVKNTLACIAFTGGDHEILGEHLKDNNAVAFGFDDPVSVAKVLTDYIKDNKNTKLAIKCGSLEGKFLDESGLKDLAKLPNKDQLRGMMLGAMNSVPSNLVGVMANVPRGFLNVLSAYKDQKEAA